jgi:hypothetical protein
VWATTEAGKAIPLDPDPRDDGNLIDDTDRPRGGPFVRSLSAQRALGEDDPETRYVSHYVTCPQAADWRKR